MLNRYLTGKISKLSIYLLITLLFWSFFAQPIFAQQKEGAVDIISVGEGPPPKLDSGREPEEGIITSLDDAKRKAVISFVIETIGEDRFYKAMGGIDSLIIRDYEKYILDYNIISETSIPLSTDVMLKVRVNVDADNLTATLENISRLEPEPEPEKALTAEEKDTIIRKANEKFLQGEVASEFLLDRIRGIELFMSARSLYESVGYKEGVYKCLLGMGKARASIAYLSDAIRDFGEAKKLAQEMTNKDYIAQVDLETAKALFMMGDYKAAREITSSVISRYPKKTEIPFGESLLLLGKIDYALGRDKEAIDEITRANSIFEDLGDTKRFNSSLLTLSLIHVSMGNGNNVIDDLKLSKGISERIEDQESKTIALIALASAYVDPDNINKKNLDLSMAFLEEAISTAEKSGWILGEAWARSEAARLLLLGGKYAEAMTEADSAVETARLSGSPKLLAAAYYIQGEIFLEGNKKTEALKSLVSCVEAASDMRVMGKRDSETHFDEEMLLSALSSVLELAMDFGKEEVGFRALMKYQGAWLSREIFLSSIETDGKNSREKLLSIWMESERNSIGAESVWLTGETNRLSESSISAIIQKRDEANRSLSDTLAKISKEDPRLSRLLGLEIRDPEKLPKSIGHETAVVQYFVGGGGAFALVTTAGGLSIVKLNSDPEEIEIIIGDLVNSLEGRVPEKEPIPEGDDEEGDVAITHTPTFEEASSIVTYTIMSPVIDKLSGIKAVGISPGISLSDLPIFSLGRYNEEGNFSLLVSEYDIFYVSSLSPDILIESPMIPTLDYLTIAGGGKFSPADFKDLFYEVHAIDGNNPPDFSDIFNSETILVLNGSKYFYFNDDYNRLKPKVTVVSNTDSGEVKNRFFEMELLTSLGPGSVFFVPGDITRSESTEFLSSLTLNIRGHGIFDGSLLTLRDYAKGYEGEGDKSWASLLFLTSLYVSETKR